MWSLTPFRPLGNNGGRSVTPARGPLVDRFFSDAFDEMVNRVFEPVAGDTDVAAARVDIHDTGKAFEVQADLPGVTKDDVKVTVEDNRVSIEAQVKREREQKDGERIVYSERCTSKFVRAFSLPAEVDSNGAQAKLDNGVLTLTLPKKASVIAKQLTVN
ncbi:MAG: Hsp20/alpha crystallin family protein [Betaproteobacteria bacterium]|nr:Hsp20/alpha crystallin family protein [Betaproteobacteria bacterium]